MTATLTFAPDTAMALGLASTALPFARGCEEEAERWLRILRLHGQAGVALQALGVGEERLAPPAGAEGSAAGDEQAQAGEPRRERDPVTEVSDLAVRLADGRDADCVQTIDLLVAVMRVYGRDFERALEAHGTDRAELVERLTGQFGLRIA